MPKLNCCGTAVLGITIAAVISVLFAGTILAILALSAAFTFLVIGGTLLTVIYLKRYILVYHRAQAKARESRKVIQGKVIYPNFGGTDGDSEYVLREAHKAIERAHHAVEREPLSLYHRIH